ncbi:MAG: TolB family protein [Gemmatimonadaceae bacterium]
MTAFLTACGDSATGPSASEPSLKVIAGAGVTDTIETQPIQALVVEARGEGGKVISGAVVRFEAQPSTDPNRPYDPAVSVCGLTVPMCNYSQFVTDTTDRSGRAKVVVRLGRVVGKATVRVTVPLLGVQDSATYTVTPGAPKLVLLSPSDTILDIGGTATIQAHLADRYGNPRTEVPALSASAGNTITVDAASKTVTARDMGTQWVYARYATASDSAIVRVVPPGRLVVWSPGLATVRLVDINGKNEQNIITGVQSDWGVFPRFDLTRQRITMHTGTAYYGGPSNDAIVIDTTRTPRRDIAGIDYIFAVRQTDDGNVMVVGVRNSDAYFSLFRVTADNTITVVATLYGMGATYGGADISYDGNRVAYISGGALNVLNVSTGVTTTLDQNAQSPRWSVQGDRLAYLSTPACSNFLDGALTIINADGSGRSVLANYCYSPGLAWSPDGKYVIGRSSQSYTEVGLRIIRVSDGAQVVAGFVSGFSQMDYYQPDWR